MKLTRHKHPNGNRGIEYPSADPGDSLYLLLIPATGHPMLFAPALNMPSRSPRTGVRGDVAILSRRLAARVLRAWRAGERVPHLPTLWDARQGCLDLR